MQAPHSCLSLALAYHPGYAGSVGLWLEPKAHKFTVKGEAACFEHLAMARPVNCTIHELFQF